MTWNYRIMRRREANGERTFEIHEVYYGRDDRFVVGWSKEAIAPLGTTCTEVHQDLVKMMEAFNKPVLDYETGRPIEPEGEQDE